MKRKMTMVLLMVLGVLVAGGSGLCAGPLEPRTLLAIFAHPDDETVVMPLLSRYAREGVQVKLAFATDGGKGTKNHAAIPAGERLAQVRADEARCAARRLGIAPPIFLGLEDGGLTQAGSLSALHDAVARLLDELKPDAVITWGPGGGSGHPDHRMVSNVVTEVFQEGVDPRVRSLFYVAFPRAAVESLPHFSSHIARWQRRNLHPTHRHYLPVRIAFTPEDRQATEQALACHRSQMTPQAIAEILQLLDHLWNGTVYLRPWNGGAAGTDLF